MAGSQQQQQQQAVSKPTGGKHGNNLPLWGNEKTMNLNPMILTNVLSSPYFKVQLYELKTYHEVVDEIYFKVAKLPRADTCEACGFPFCVDFVFLVVTHSVGLYKNHSFLVVLAYIEEYRVRP